MADAFFERVPRALVRASRNSGKTRILSLLHFANSLHKPECWSTNVGATKEQSHRGYDYFRRYCLDELFAGSIIGDPLAVKTEFRNGSRVEVLTGGSEKSVSGPQPQKAAFDEIDHWLPMVLETALQMTSSKQGIMGQTWLLSSQYHEVGLMSHLWETAQNKGFKRYQWCLFDVMERCPSCLGEGCPLYQWTDPVSNEIAPLCKGRGLIAEGHIKYEDAVGKFLLASPGTFALQQLLHTVRSVRGLVYPQFNSQQHHQPVPADWASDNWRFFAGVDLRSNAAIEVGAFWRGTRSPVYIVDEWYEELTTPSRVREAAVALQQKWKIRRFWPDPTQPDEIREWQLQNLPAVAPPRTPIMYGVKLIRDLLRNVLGEPNIFFCSTPRLLWELERGYRVRHNRGTGTYVDDDPINKDNHAADALRYMIVGHQLSSSGGTWRMY